MKVNHELSQKIAKKIKVIPKSCWLNAAKALDFFPEQATYIEGWIVEFESYRVVEHGWLELYGEIMDVSMYTINILEYFPGLRLRNPPKQGNLL